MSKIEICNEAIAHIAATPIASLDEASQPARYCKVFFDAARDATLRDYPWNFAGSRITLNALTVPDEFSEWAYAYQYPSECLKARDIVDTTNVDDPLADPLPFVVQLHTDQTTGIETKLILTNVDAAVLKYTKRVVNTELFDSQFREAFALKLGMLISYPITKKKSIVDTMTRRYAAFMDFSRGSDASEGKVRMDNADDPWVNARLGGS